MSRRQLPPLELLRQLIRYEPETGKLFWRRRPVEMFSSLRIANSWNSQFADKEAFTYVTFYGYRQGNLLNTAYYAHRVAWTLHTGVEPSDEIDHINGDKCDNRITNLREAIHAENMKNVALRVTSASNYIGVSWMKTKGKWRARVKEGGKEKHLGLFDCKIEAAKARDRAAIEFYGPFARLNFPAEAYSNGL